MKSIKLDNLQMLRGLAAILVCIHHSRYLINIGNEDEILDTVRGGIGVPLFFIISGFIMVYSTRKLSADRLQNAKEFMLKRLIRIIPLFYFSVFGLLVIYHNNIARYFTADLPQLIKTLLFIPLFTDNAGPAFGFSFMYVSWSLNYEMVFYVIFAVSLLFVRYRYYFIYLVFFLLVLVLPLLFKGYLSLDQSTNYQFDWKYLNFLTNPILLLFLLGVTFGLIIKKFKPGSLVIYGMLSLSVILFTAYFTNIIPYFVGSDLIICGLLVFSILLLDFNRETVKPHRFIVYLGDISYSIYLFHPLVFIYLSAFVRHKGYTQLESSWYFLIIGFSLVLVISSITYELIEKRFTNYLKKRWLQPVKPVTRIKTVTHASS